MRLFLLAFILLFAQATNADPLRGIFYGKIETYEVYSGGQWIDAIPTLSDTAMSLSLYFPWGSRCANEPSTTHCYGQPFRPIGHELYLDQNAGGLRVAPAIAQPCWPKVGICEPYDPLRIIREADGDYAFIGDLMTETDQDPNRPGSFMHAIRLHLEGHWIPPGIVDFTSLRGINGSIVGYGDFEQTSGRDPEGSTRGTFSIHTGYVPTPGTLALLALGALGVALRRRH
ncbi:MAG: MYXO-CTERM sorting domain-containing protein [Burkholderiaceae bacterium]